MTSSKQCISCLRHLPTSFYGPYRRSADGLNSYCMDCAKERSRRLRNRRYGIVDYSKVKYSGCIFHFDTQNETILDLALLRQTTQLPCFDVSTNAQYAAHFETLDPIGLQVWIKGSPIPAIRLYGFPGEDMKPSILKWLKRHSIRLERDDLSLHETIALLYQKNSL